MVRFVIASLAIAAGIAGFVGSSNKADAGPISGRPESGTYVVPAMSIDTLSVTLKGNESTLILLSGDGDSCLELRVYDDFGTLLASDTIGLGDDRIVSFTPRFTGKVKIKVTNLGKVSNKYSIVVS